MELALIRGGAFSAHDPGMGADKTAGTRDDENSEKNVRNTASCCQTKK
jgi:hypothetical protein